MWAEEFLFVPHSLCLPLNPLRCSKHGRRGLFSSPTHSACHQPPPSLETRAEGSFVVTHTLCLPPTSSVTRNASGGVILCHPHSLPATNPLRRSKCEWRGLLSATNILCRSKPGKRGFFFVTHIFCLPPPPSVARNASGGLFVTPPHQLPATTPPPVSKRERRVFS